ncbi:hypothetical protein QSV34_06740 [Porticoccus sp. W117]|uniref:hypothetical protein n=1 Tax=Porticoccus sp. W117 TaxID=3054777 RepID=UPI002594B333|nr:hypothetical protein [Porticoccus sp. W117]MDM3871051.1 hypothetical protein [Porticoccus sp. W117]
MKRAFLTFVTLLFSNISCGDVMLCDENKSAGQFGDLSRPESEFNYRKYQASLDYLSKIPRMFAHAEQPEKVARSAEVWIGYLNSLVIVQGYNLKQAALFEPTKKNIEAFCEFLETDGRYVD